MGQKLGYLKETPSQTAGPYVHIGLAPGAAGFEIYERELGWDIAGPNAKGERIRVEGVVIDGTGSRSRTCCWRLGKPMRTASMPIRSMAKAWRKAFAAGAG